MKKYFFYCDATGDSRFFNSEVERDKKLLEFIDRHCVEDGVYDADIIEDIKIGVITHELKFKVLDKIETYENPEDWEHRRDIEKVGEYKLKWVD